MRDEKKWSLTLEIAEDCFWAAIAERHPEATSGDIPPEVELEFEQACARAANAWYDMNVPKQPTPPSANVALIEIMNLLNETEEWDMSTLNRVAEIVNTATNRQRVTCTHLADHEEPAPNFHRKPCSRCGLYYVNDGDRGGPDEFFTPEEFDADGNLKP